MLRVCERCGRGTRERRIRCVICKLLICYACVDIGSPGELRRCKRSCEVDDLTYSRLANGGVE